MSEGLRAPFDVTHIKEVELKNGTKLRLDYISWSQAADRLDDAAPFDWSFSVVQVGDDWAWGRLTIGSQSFDNIGYAENADASWKSEVLKDAVSDAFKRCCALAGVGRYLYDKDAPSTGRAVTPPPARPAALPRPTAVPDDPFGDSLGDPIVAAKVALAGDDACPVHGQFWRLVPAGTSKATGKPYEAFYACPERTCKEKPPRGWVA